MACWPPKDTNVSLFQLHFNKITVFHTKSVTRLSERSHFSLPQIQPLNGEYSVKSKTVRYSPPGSPNRLIRRRVTLAFIMHWKRPLTSYTSFPIVRMLFKLPSTGAVHCWCLWSKMLERRCSFIGGLIDRIDSYTRYTVDKRTRNRWTMNLCTGTNRTSWWWTTIGNNHRTCYCKWNERNRWWYSFCGGNKQHSRKIIRTNFCCSFTKNVRNGGIRTSEFVA